MLVDAAGDLLGALPPVPVAMPYWQEASDVVAAAREAYGIDVTVLRLLEADRPAPHGGTVTYLAQLDGPPPPDLREVAEDLRPRPHPLRLPYAEPGGPARSLAWARERLGWPAMTAVQQRTWNLSAIWRLDGPDGRRVWLKQVPPFFDHEGAVLRWLDGALPGVAPHLIAAGDEGRVLLGDVPGVDGYDADVAQVQAIAAVHHRVQVRAAAANGELAAAGVPDRRGPRLGCVDPRRRSPVTGRRSTRSCRTSTRGWPPSPPAACRTPSSTATCTAATPGSARGRRSSSTGATRAWATRRSTCSG